jgi:GTP diphosphokinase / guanosine-3',5'-bis(diphosphate) 3'-diphosphatase
MTTVIEAYYFAQKAHVGQVRKYTGEPYFNHVEQVASYVASYDMPDEVIAAALLHDVIEDTVYTADDLYHRFPRYVVNMVRLLTDTPNNIGNRAMRKAADRQRLRFAPREVKIIKCADLIDNTSTIVDHDPTFAKVYLEEKRLLLDLMVVDHPLYDKAIKTLKTGIEKLESHTKV